MTTAATDSLAPDAVAHYRGRFAPSPTGPLHFGSLVAALASFCDARAAGGEWLVRIEDVDAPRTRLGATAQILATLERYGFEWDGPVTRQSERTSLYEEALEQLRAAGLAFACGCTRRQVGSTSALRVGERVYPGTCRNGRPPSRGGSHPSSWRVRVGDAIVTCHDRLQGAQQQDMARDVGDFVVKRADGLFAYQLAVVVDDAEQGITDIARGADLLASTPRQILLQRLLGLPTPAYLHVPVAINPAGEKLSKQTRAPPLPAAPVPALLAAWRFLDQQPVPDPHPSLAQFWAFARASWRASRVPPVVMLPAPDDSGARSAPRHKPGVPG